MDIFKCIYDHSQVMQGNAAWSRASRQVLSASLACSQNTWMIGMLETSILYQRQGRVITWNVATCVHFNHNRWRDVVRSVSRGFQKSSLVKVQISPQVDKIRHIYSIVMNKHKWINECLEEPYECLPMPTILALISQPNRAHTQVWPYSWKQLSLKYARFRH